MLDVKTENVLLYYSDADCARHINYWNIGSGRMNRSTIMRVMLMKLLCAIIFVTTTNYFLNKCEKIRKNNLPSKGEDLRPISICRDETWSWYSSLSFSNLETDNSRVIQFIEEDQ